MFGNRQPNKFTALSSVYPSSPVGSFGRLRFRRVPGWGGVRAEFDPGTLYVYAVRVFAFVQLQVVRSAGQTVLGVRGVGQPVGPNAVVAVAVVRVGGGDYGRDAGLV